MKSFIYCFQSTLHKKNNNNSVKILTNKDCCISLPTGFQKISTTLHTVCDKQYHVQVLFGLTDDCTFFPFSALWLTGTESYPVQEGPRG